MLMDMSQFECTCKNYFISRGDKLFSERFGITQDEAHALGDQWEEVLDEVIAKGWRG